MDKKKNFSIVKTVIILFVAAIIGYFYITSRPASEVYKIKAAGGESGYKASFINTTGKDAEDKKIKLSDDYWSSGKFN